MPLFTLKDQALMDYPVLAQKDRKNIDALLEVPEDRQKLSPARLCLVMGLTTLMLLMIL